MPITYSITGRIFRVDFVGICTSEDVREAFSEAFANPDFPEEALFLVDVRYSDTARGRPIAEVRELTESIGALAAGRSKRFAVVGEPGQFGVIRMASVFAASHGIEVRLFEDLLEALTWLDETRSARSPGCVGGRT